MVLCRSISLLAGRIPAPQVSVRIPAPHVSRLRVRTNRHRPGFSLSSVGAHDEPLQSQPNPLNLNLFMSVRYPRDGHGQTHCAYLACFHQLNPEKRPLFRQRVVARSEIRGIDASAGLSKANKPIGVKGNALSRIGQNMPAPNPLRLSRLRSASYPLKTACFSTKDSGPWCRCCPALHFFSWSRC